MVGTWEKGRGAMGRNFHSPVMLSFLTTPREPLEAMYPDRGVVCIGLGEAVAPARPVLWEGAGLWRSKMATMLGLTPPDLPPTSEAAIDR